MKVFANLQKETHLARNPFDLSHYDVFTTKVGIIRPVFCLETLPNDHIEITPSNYLRTMQPLQTDAFVKASQNLDFYFVPFQQLWSEFPEFYSKVNDPQSSSGSYSGGYDSVPFFDIVSLIIDACGYSYSSLNFGISPDVDMLTSGSNTLSIYKQWFFGMIDLLDTLGYGNFLPTLENLAKSYGLDSIFVGDDFETLIDSIRIDPAKARLLWRYNINEVDENYQLNVSAFRVMAYQRVWYNYFRNHYYDIDNDNYRFMINADFLNDLSGSADLLSELPTSAIIELFSLRYRQWKKDLVTGLLPSAQFGDVAVASLDGSISVDSSVFGSNSAVNGWPFDEVSQDDNGRITGVNNDEGSSRFVVHTTANASNAGVSVLQIRTAEALQRWKENTLRAGVKTTNQFKAHFGVEPRYVRDWYPDFLGSCDGVVNITSVTSQSDTGQSGNGKLGDVAGNISSALSHKKITFDAKDFGVIIGVYSILPDAQYSAFGIDEHNIHLTPDDFYIPEFQNIGLAPVYTRNVDVVSGFYGKKSTVLGYAPRYLEYKYRQSLVHGLLYGATKMFNKSSSDPSAAGRYYNFAGMFNNWVVPRHESISYDPQGGDFGSDVNRFYVHPNVLDSVFYAADDGTPASDQLILAFNFDVKAVRPISVIGLPQY